MKKKTTPGGIVDKVKARVVAAMAMVTSTAAVDTVGDVVFVRRVDRLILLVSSCSYACFDHVPDSVGCRL